MNVTATESTLDAAAMLAKAQAETGLSDWGDATLPERFGLAVDHLNGIGMDAAGRRNGGRRVPLAADFAAGVLRGPQPLPDRR